MDNEASVIIRRDGRVGRILLNRPKALNALDRPMIHAIADALAVWRDMPDVHAVAIEGAGDRAFCAGGDIRDVRARAMAGDLEAVHGFFAEEYALNAAIAGYPKPYVALIDGICMGGGVGLSVHGTLRVATEKALVAMPETGIGMFPDVGASYVLPRLPGALGMFLGLTGTRLSGADAVHAGFATHYVPHDRIAAVSAALAEDGVAVLAGFAAPLPPFSLQADRAAIDRCFGAESVGEILRRLASEDTDWARRTLESLHRMSPSAVHWSFRIIRDGARRTLHQCQAAELELVMRVARHAEFHEGVRAMIVDKDRQPQWTPARLEDVDPASTEAMFAPGSLADLQLMASRGPMVNLETRRAL